MYTPEIPSYIFGVIGIYVWVLIAKQGLPVEIAKRGIFAQTFYYHIISFVFAYLVLLTGVALLVKTSLIEVSDLIRW
ncbi:hypothetical protein [Halalkalibacter alkaliphilus]|uniref:Uncharacterized protein n=1 Tax=Halalkalibacter alkaliphilus TaxID=2917993 RepID=A0A9X2I6P1_9BACI|nr:hypothetical protein [Halalkalibacter alkaliphilus]MCL7748763.1 hypothetical protein [Halalkalibacter alkaliphilus]